MAGSTDKFGLSNPKPPKSPNRIYSNVNIPPKGKKSLFSSKKEITINNSLQNKLNEVVKTEKNEQLSNALFISSLCEYLQVLIEQINNFVKRDPSKIFAFSNQASTVAKKSSKTFAEEKHGIYEKVNLNFLLNFCFKIFQFRQKYEIQKRNIDLCLDIENSLPKYIYSDDVRLKQVIINLLSNAYKFTPTGNVILRAKKLVRDEERNDQEQNEELHLYSTAKLGRNFNNFIRIEIIDSGLGMSKEEIDSLFKPFSQLAKNQDMNINGSGLGLSVVKETLKELNIEIKVESEVNKGSIFYFDIPFLDDLKKKIDNELLEDSSINNDSSSSSKLSIVSGSDSGSFKVKTNDLRKRLKEDLFHVQDEGVDSKYTFTISGPIESAHLNSNRIKRESMSSEKDPPQAQFFKSTPEIAMKKKLSKSTLINAFQANSDKVQIQNKHEISCFLRKLKEQNAENASAFYTGFSSRTYENENEVNREEKLLSNRRRPRKSTKSKKGALRSIFNVFNTNNNYFRVMQLKGDTESLSSVSKNFGNDSSDLKKASLELDFSTSKVHLKKVGYHEDKEKSIIIPRKNIMIVDDDNNVLRSAKIIFERIGKNLGISVCRYEALNSIDCLYTIQKNYYNGVRMDLLLLDENMPGIKGSRCCKLLKEMMSMKELNTFPIYSTSVFDHATEQDYKKSFEIDGFISKPFKLDEIQKLI